MAAPAVALRFRDTLPTVDTIAAHREVLRSEGAVWWGWWKKDFEKDHREFLLDLEAKAPFEALVIDRSTRRTFRAVVSRLRVGQLDTQDLTCIPAYYLELKDRVFAWFLFSSIEDATLMTGPRRSLETIRFCP